MHGDSNASQLRCIEVWLVVGQVSLPTQYNGKNQDPVGALSGALARLQANRPLRELREIAKGVTKQLPEPIQVCTWISLLQCSSAEFDTGKGYLLSFRKSEVTMLRPQEATAKIDEYARGMISGSGSTLFEELGLYYIGPIDGHDLDLLVTMLQGMLLSFPSTILPRSLCMHLLADISCHMYYILVGRKYIRSRIMMYGSCMLQR